MRDSFEGRCRLYQKEGGCRFGAGCKYAHAGEKVHGEETVDGQTFMTYSEEDFMRALLKAKQQAESPGCDGISDPKPDPRVWGSMEFGNLFLRHDGRRDDSR